MRKTKIFHEIARFSNMLEVVKLTIKIFMMMEILIIWKEKKLNFIAEVNSLIIGYTFAHFIYSTRGGGKGLILEEIFAFS